MHTPFDRFFLIVVEFVTFLCILFKNFASPFAYLHVCYMVFIVLNTLFKNKLLSVLLEHICSLSNIDKNGSSFHSGHLMDRGYLNLNILNHIFL